MTHWFKVLAAAVLPLAACSPAGPEGSAAAKPVSVRPTAAAATPHPVSGLPIVALRIRSGSKVHRFRVELARTSEEQARGLMFRRAMGADEGMIFPMQPPRYASFWMRNTPLPLDLIFIAPDGRIASIAANARPLSDDQILSGAVVKAVLELNGGRAQQLGLSVGDRVEW